MDDFIQTLSSEQREALLKALVGDHVKGTVESRWQHEEPASEAVDGVAEQKPETSRAKDAEDFTMHKKTDSGLPKSGRREPVRARKNTWVDTGSEAKDVTTPEVNRTPRNRKPPAKKQVTCHACGKKFKVNANIVYGEYYRCDRCTGR
jgi:DNA-directed RNA polymerase subunit RPC12/RpoP